MINTVIQKYYIGFDLCTDSFHSSFKWQCTKAKDKKTNLKNPGLKMLCNTLSSICDQSHQDSGIPSQILTEAWFHSYSAQSIKDSSHLTSYKHCSPVQSFPHWMSQLILCNHHSGSKWTNRCNSNGNIYALKWLIARDPDEKYSNLLFCKSIYIIFKTFYLEWYKAQCFKMRINTWACLCIMNFRTLAIFMKQSLLLKSCRLSPYVGL